ncbi:MAG: SWIB/MDM2 domain-containing protein [Candidatus Zixiibacteriota bacterium]|nr:MAG: SWIB/MDM2 domain-containing protein [candidate division Zixibacteria bacterium]
MARKKPAKKKVAKKKPAKKKVAKKKPAKKKVAKKKPAKKKVAKKKVAKKKKAAPKKKATARKAKPRKAAKRKPAKKKAKRKPNPAFMRPMTLSADLGAVVGSKPIPRTEVTRKLWAYIKKNKLQDTVNRRMINADAKLKKVFGGKGKVNMFEMTKLVARHMK